MHGSVVSSSALSAVLVASSTFRIDCRLFCTLVAFSRLFGSRDIDPKL